MKILDLYKKYGGDQKAILYMGEICVFKGKMKDIVPWRLNNSETFLYCLPNKPKDYLIAQI
jgi:hypothetical protein